MITLKSSDEKLVEVPETVARQSKVITHQIEDMNSKAECICVQPTIEVLTKVITYCEKHVREGCSATSASNEELGKWDKQFVDVDNAMLYDLLMAAYSLEIDGLVDLTCQKVADMIKNKNPKEIRDILNIQPNLTPEEDEQICLENQWAFDP